MSEDTDQVPLYVDLDGTLIKTDLLFESLILLLKEDMRSVFLVPFWLFKGKAAFKDEVARRIDLRVDLLPVHQPFLKYLREESDKGRRIVLATASNEVFARKIADHFAIFSSVLSSDQQTNLSGNTKLRKILEQSPEREFDYAGNDMIDLEIFPRARNTILVNPAAGVETRARRSSRVIRVFDDRTTGLSKYFRAIRVHQWMKNILLFVALFTSHNWCNAQAIMNVLIGFFAFSCCASGTYVLNDLLDLFSDRQHHRKKNRPFACGDISIQSGVMLVFVLITLGIIVAGMISLKFFGILMAYLLCTFLYSFLLKLYVLIDVIVLAGLYTLRVIAGAVAIDVVISFWLLAFSMFIFFSLALVKRCSELIRLKEDGVQFSKGRDYQVPDIRGLQSMGIASGYLSVLVVAFYINSDDVLLHYPHSKILWMLCPLLLYWISRLWLKTERGEMHDDPVVFSFTDRASWVIAVIILFVVLLGVVRFY